MQRLWYIYESVTLSNKISSLCNENTSSFTDYVIRKIQENSETDGKKKK
jgi:hypothetical protein